MLSKPLSQSGLGAFAKRVRADANDTGSCTTLSTLLAVFEEEIDAARALCAQVQLGEADWRTKALKDAVKAAHLVAKHH